MDQQAGQGADQRLVGHQQQLAIAVAIELTKYLARIAVRRQPGHAMDTAGETQGFTDQRGGLLRTHIGTGQDRTERTPLQLHRRLTYLLATTRRQAALGIAALLFFY